MTRIARGFTLIELVVAITIIGICATTVFGLLSVISLRSAAVLVNRQAISIANAYMEEVLSKPFAVGPQSGARDQFDDIMDYNTLPDTVVRDQYGTPVVGLAGYRVTVAVANVVWGNVTPGEARRILVTVTDPLNETFSVTAYKTSL